MNYDEPGLCEACTYSFGIEIAGRFQRVGSGFRVGPTPGQIRKFCGFAIETGMSERPLAPVRTSQIPDKEQESPGVKRLAGLMVPAERIELPTFGLQNRCTTAVLRRPSDAEIRRLFGNRPNHVRPKRMIQFAFLPQGPSKYKINCSAKEPNRP
jgi:hypothetical protein